MKPPPFSYHDPRTVTEVVDLLSRFDNARVLAGGQSLMPMLNMRFVQPDHIVDLNCVEDLSRIEIGANVLAVGAMVRQRDLEFHEEVTRRCPLMHEALLQVGHRQTRNRGTIGGSLCQLDPAAELVAVAAALDAVIDVEGPSGRRQVAFADFPSGYMTPSIGFDEVVTAVHVPLWRPGHGSAFVEFARRHGDFAIVSAAVLIEEDQSGCVERVSLTLGGVGPIPLRMRALEQRLIGHSLSPALFAEVRAACHEIEAMDDAQVPGSYRRKVAGTLMERALKLAHDRIGKADGTRSP